MPRNQSRPSFIPKSDSFSSPPERKRGGGSTLILISLGFFIVAVLAAGVLFFYQQRLESNLADRQQELEQARSAFDPALIDELAAFESQVSTANTLLNQHLALTPLFPIIENATLTNVQFNSMDVSYDGGKESSEGGQMTTEADISDAVFTVQMSGIGPNYASIALQSSELINHDKIKNPVLSDFSLNNEGDVEFSVQFSVPEKHMLYKNTI